MCRNSAIDYFSGMSGAQSYCIVNTYTLMHSIAPAMTDRQALICFNHANRRAFLLLLLSRRAMLDSRVGYHLCGNPGYACQAHPYKVAP